MSAAVTSSVIQAVATVQDAVRDALRAAVQALAAGEVSLAQRHWHSAHAALQVLNHAALVKLSTALGELLPADSGGNAEDRAAAFRAGCDALTAYMASLRAGERDQPLRWWPQYEAMQRARGVAQPLESEFFFPDLSAGPGDRTGAVVLSGDELRATRRQLETGLLQWLRKNDSAGLQQITDAVTQVEAAQAGAGARRLWWVARGVFDALLQDGLAADALARRLATQLNLHLGRMLQGPAETPEALLRDALYLAAKAQPVTPLVAEVQRVCGLQGAFEIDMLAFAGGAVGAGRYTPEAVAAARQKLEGLQALWAECAAGSTSPAQFEVRARALAASCEALGTPALAALAAQMADTARSAVPPATIGEAPALEVACALLMIESALAADHAPGAQFAVRAQHMLARLKASVQSPQSLAAMAPAQLLDEAALQAQSAQHRAQVYTEIERDLKAVELALEAWFSNTSNVGLIAGLDKPLRQVGGAFAVLGHDDAAALAQQCREHVMRHAQGAPCGEAESRFLSRRMTVLTTFVEALKFGPVQLESVLTRLAITMPIPVQPEPEAGLLALSLRLAQAPAVPAEVPQPQESLPLPVVAPTSAAQVDGAGEIDAEMLEIFLEEADEVLATIQTTVPQSRAQPQDQEHLTTLRRAFHTLKGSGRMVGLKHMAEAAWEMEQVMNDLLPTQRPGTPDLYRLIEYAQHRFTHWIGLLRKHRQAAVDAALLMDCARKLRAGEPLPAELEPAALSAPEAPAVMATTLDIVSEYVRVGDISVSRTLYDIMLPEARQNVSILEEQNRRIQAGAPITPAFIRAAHTLRGISASAGFTAVSKLSASLEHALEPVANSGVAPVLALRELAGHAVAALVEQVASIAARQAPATHAELAAALDAAGASPVAAQAEAAPISPDTSTAVPGLPPIPQVPDVPAVVVPLAVPVDAVALTTAITVPMAIDPSSAPIAGMERRRGRVDDDVDPQLLPIFLEEAAELVPQVGQDLRAWRARPEDKLVAQSLKRLLHTLKGSARMAGAMALGQLTHGMESRIENAQLLPSIPESLIDELETSFDRIGMLIGRLQGVDSTTRKLDATQLPQALSEMSRTMQMATVTGVMTQAIPVQSLLDAEALAIPGLAAGLPRPLLRVRADMIDRLANQAGEVSIARARVSAELRSARGSLRDLTDNVTRLRAQLRELEIQAETQMQSRFSPVPEHAGGKFDPLEFDRFTRLQELTRLLAESVNDVATVQHSLARDLDEAEKALAAQAVTTRDVQQDLMAIRMVQFGSISDRLYRVSRLSAKDSEKRVALDIVGEHVEIDRSVMDRIAAPIEHLLRNAIVHGIEAPKRRLELGKAEAGALRLEVRQEGNEVMLSLTDDGAGLNIDRIREKAINLGLMRADEPLTDQQIGNFIFRSGFSTADGVTTEAGRGVGMDVVMSEITALGGRVNTQFERGKGTVFTIYLPLTLSVLQSVVMRVGGNYYAVPTMMVEQVQRLKKEVLDAATAAHEIEWQGTRYPFHHLRTLLDVPADDDTPQSHGAVLLLRTGTGRAAIQVDDIIGGQEIVIKNIGSQLARVPGVTGAAVLGSGETVLILNPVALTQRYLDEAARVPSVEPAALREAAAATAVPSEPAAAAAPQRPRTVLVVDDSLTVRKITDRLLTREGYVVVVAKDGIEALEKLRDQLPDVMLTDVEMPRMDGFDLTRNVRADEHLKYLPIIMITSRTAEKHREHAAELGVDVFLGKPYEEGELLRHIAALAQRTKPH